MMKWKNGFIALLLIGFALVGQAQVWKDPKAPVDERVEDLLSRMTLDEKISYCGSQIPGIERLGIPDFEWYGEALHGIIAWNCTQFPQNIAMGSTWNPDLMFEVATAISNEARALKNAGQKEVMMFSPTVNMARDPRWGRNEECYSEDPFLMSEMARMYVRGMQGNDPHYVKTVTTVKHFVANNVDKGREFHHSYINKKELYDYYFPAYRTCIVDEEATGIMTALNGLNGIPCSAHNWLVNGVLRGEWGFKGYVIADWAAVEGLEKRMKYAHSQPEAAALAIKAGIDQECFRSKNRRAPMVDALKPAIEQGLLTEEELDVSVRRLLRLRFLTGDFDDPALIPYSKIPTSVLECDAHRKLALKAAEQSIVLLKNDGILPLKKEVKNLAVIGPFADRCWTGIYSGFPKHRVSPLEGIKNYTGGNVHYAQGCGVVADSLDDQRIEEAVALARKSECVVLVLGNDENTATENVDRMSLSLPGNQHRLVREVYAANKNVVLVLVPSGSTSVGWEQEHLPAIVCAWPNGQEQGTALAEVLFGDVNPGGKLSSTWFKSEADLPDFNDYHLAKGRTYMYFRGEPLYPFGYGLSYTQFKLDGAQLSSKVLNVQGKLLVSVDVANVGDRDGDEVMQVYVRKVQAKQPAPLMALKGFKRITVKAGGRKTVEIPLPYEAFSEYDTTLSKYVVEAGTYEVLVGNSSRNITSALRVKVKGSELPDYRLGRKSAYYHLYDENRKKNWDFIYTNLDAQKTVSGDEPDVPWVEFEITFNDPGFYVNTWDAVLHFGTVTKEAVIGVSMAGSDVAQYQLLKDQHSRKIKIPIPPEYGKPVRLRVKTFHGKVECKSVEILPPGNQKPFVVDRVVARSE